MFSIDIILPSALCSWSRLSILTKNEYLVGKDGQCLVLTTFMYRLSRIFRSLSHLELSRELCMTMLSVT
jgi:hypothetical protein